jgi:multiple sugar transport system substrate-binding protein
VLLSCAPAKRPQPVEVVFWQTWPLHVVSPLVAEFERTHPGLRVRLEHIAPQEARGRVLAALAADTLPDLCEVGSSWMPALLASGRLTDWSAGVADLRAGLRGWELCSVGEALYGVPWVLRARALFYDKALFARARLDSASSPGTWGDLARDAAAIQRLGRGVHGFGIPTGEGSRLAREVLPFVWGNGGHVLSDDLRRAEFDSSRTVEAIEFYVGLRRAGLLAGRDTLEREFAAGRLGLTLSGAALIGRIHREAPGLRYGVAPVPRPLAERGTHAVWADGELLVSFAGSRRKHEALELARFLVQPENALALASTLRVVEPATTDADTSAYYRGRPGEAALVRQLASARFAPNHPAWDAMETAIEDEVGAALAGRKDAGEAVRDAQARLAALLGKH